MLNDLNVTETIKNMRRRTTRLEREGDYWTESDKKELESLFIAGYGISEIAIQLQRTEPAVFQQIEKMDLYQRKEYPTRRKRTKPPVVPCPYSRNGKPLCKLNGQSPQMQEEQYVQ